MQIHPDRKRDSVAKSIYNGATALDWRRRKTQSDTIKPEAETGRQDKSATEDRRVATRRLAIVVSSYEKFFIASSLHINSQRLINVRPPPA